MAATMTNTNQEQVESLKRLMLRVAKLRDEQAFGKLFDHYAPLIRSYSLAREPGAELVADELAQEVMIRIWEKAHTYKPEMAGVNTWVFTMARNCRIDYLRRNGRFASQIDPEDIFAQLEDEGPSPFELALQQRSDSNLYQSLEQLPPEQAEVLRKVYLEGKTHQEASEVLKLPLGTIKSRVRLALKKLELLVTR
jgi:RNA polymerase sigma-70 factor (ECF subfamily)